MAKVVEVDVFSAEFEFILVVCHACTVILCQYLSNMLDVLVRCLQKKYDVDQIYQGEVPFYLCQQGVHQALKRP